jgi:hypothetical protein
LLKLAVAAKGQHQEPQQPRSPMVVHIGDLEDAVAETVTGLDQVNAAEIVTIVPDKHERRAYLRLFCLFGKADMQRRIGADDIQDGAQERQSFRLPESLSLDKSGQNVGVQPETRKVEKGNAIDLADIHAFRMTAPYDIKGRRHLQRHANVFGEMVDRSDGHNAQPAIGIEEARGDTVHRAVAARCDNGVDTLSEKGVDLYLPRFLRH